MLHWILLLVKSLTQREVDYSKINTLVWLRSMLMVTFAGFVLISFAGALTYFVLHYGFGMEGINTVLPAIAAGILLLSIFIGLLSSGKFKFMDYFQPVPKNDESG
jgi:hypothetical protein